MLQRTQNAAFLGGAYVFPGGSLDPPTRRAMLRRVVGLTEAEANARLRLAAGRPRLLRRRGARVLRGGRRAARARRRTAHRSRPSARRALMRCRNAAVPRAAGGGGPLHPRRRARLLRPLDHRAGPLAALRHALLRRAGARGPGGRARRRRDGAPRLDHAARRARARREAARSSWCPRRRPRCATWRASPSRARAFEHARDAARDRREPRLLGAGQGRRRSCSAAPTRSTSRSTGAIREETGADHLRPRRRACRSGSTAGSRASSRPTRA